MLDATKIIRELGVIPEYDLRTGHAHTVEWFLRSGAAAVDQALSDPLWGRTSTSPLRRKPPTLPAFSPARRRPLRMDA